MENSARISVKVSLDATKELYLIIVGIGITEALTHTGSFDRPDEYAPYLILLAGYLMTVFRFSLGMINMLGHVAERMHRYWSKVVSFVALSFLGCGLCFFWMGMHLQHIPMFIVMTFLLILADWATLFIGHRPWAPPRGWGLWMLWKSLCIFFAYPWGCYDPRRDTRHYREDLGEEARLIKCVHYQWIRSNFWMLVVFLLALLSWYGWEPSGNRPHLKEGLFESALGLVLIVFSFWDYSVNKLYYFGEDMAEGAPGL